MEFAKAFTKLDGLVSLRERKDVFARHYQVDRMLRGMLTAQDRPFSKTLIAELFGQWGDPLSPADESYVGSCLAHAQATSGHILQCGSGLITLLLGIVCARSDEKSKHLWCLVDDRHWANVIRSWLSQYNLTNAHVVVSQPRLYEDCVWYDIDPKKIPQGFTLAISEGGRAAVGGAVGLLDRVDSRLGDNCVILARHVKASEDLVFIQQWAKRRAMQCSLVDRSTGFLKVVKSHANTNPAHDQYRRAKMS